MQSRQAEVAEWRERARELVDRFDWAEIQAFRKEMREDDVERDARSFYRLFCSEGLLATALPTPWGAGLDSLAAFAFQEELECAGLPCYGITQNRATARMLADSASADLQAEHLPKLLNGTWRYADGFSEPEAGSDLLALRTAARREGDSYVINGAKLWTSAAHLADWIVTLVRSDPSSSGSKGLSILLVDAHAPGVTIRPIRVIGGWRVNACFFDDVRVPVAQRVGEENEGWAVMRRRLAHERAMSFGGNDTRMLLARLIHRLSDSSPDPELLTDIGAFVADCEADRLLYVQVALMEARGEDTTSIAPASKVSSSELAQRFGAWAVEVLAPATLFPDADDPLAADIEELARVSTVWTIIGGTSEVQRNTIARRGLGLRAEV